MANAEARLVRHNLLHPGKPRRARLSAVPSAVFADPQVASAGATEQELRAQGRRYVVAPRYYRDTAYGWAQEDTTSFVKVLADPDSRRLLGAHLMGPQASTLIQPLIQATGTLGQDESVLLGSRDALHVWLTPDRDLEPAPGRIHLDVGLDSASDLDRLITLGATRQWDDPKGRWTVLADPQGNLFCGVYPNG
jgi:hypothetical protein